MGGHGWGMGGHGWAWVGAGGRGWAWVGVGWAWLVMGGCGWEWVGVGGRAKPCQAMSQQGIWALPVSTSDQHVHIALCRSECLTSIPVMHMLVRGSDRHSDNQYAGQKC